MVQLEEVEDAELDQAQPGPLGDDYDSDDFVDTGKRRSDLSTYSKPHLLPSARDYLRGHPNAHFPDSELSDDEIISSDPRSESLTERYVSSPSLLNPPQP